MFWPIFHGDDEWLVGRGQHYHVSLLLHMFLLDLIGSPISWHKVGGGIQTGWVGYYLDVARFEIVGGKSGLARAMVGSQVAGEECPPRRNP